MARNRSAASVAASARRIASSGTAWPNEMVAVFTSPPQASQRMRTASIHGRPAPPRGHPSSILSWGGRGGERAGAVPRKGKRRAALLPGFAGGDKKRALAEFEAAVNLDPDYTSNYEPLAKAYIHFHRGRDAVRVLKAVAAVEHPKDPAAYPDDLEGAKKLLSELAR